MAEITNAGEARLWLSKLNRLATGRDRMVAAAARLKVDLLTALRDDDLVVILAEETKRG